MQTPPPQNPTGHKQHWWLIIGIILVLIITAIGVMARLRAPHQDTQNTETVSATPQKESCATPPPVFTAPITDLSLVSQIGPLGGLNVGSASRSYIQVNRDSSNRFVTVPVYAPVDSTLTGIFHKLADYGELGSRSEYRLEFSVGCNITYALDHISQVIDAIKQAGPTEASANSGVGNQVSIPVRAGEQVGATDGTKISGNWDFYLLNFTRDNPHLKPERWKSDHNIYAECPYDYFTPDLKQQFYDKLTLWDGSKPADLTCGQINHDVAGTASGGWFQGDATDMTGTHLFLSNTATMVEVLREEHEQNVERLNPRFGFRTHNYAKLPREITVGDSTCYSGDEKYLYVRLTTADSLQTARGTGSCPTSWPSEDIEEWQR